LEDSPSEVQPAKSHLAISAQREAVERAASRTCAASFMTNDAPRSTWHVATMDRSGLTSVCKDSLSQEAAPSLACPNSSTIKPDERQRPKLCPCYKSSTYWARFGRIAAAQVGYCFRLVSQPARRVRPKPQDCADLRNSVFPPAAVRPTVKSSHIRSKFGGA
jgi:hypothetical protein